MDPAEVVLAYYARLIYDQKLQRSIWEAARLSGYMAAVPHVKKGTVKVPQDMITFSWEGESSKPARNLEMTEAKRKVIERWNREAADRKQSQ